MKIIFDILIFSVKSGIIMKIFFICGGIMESVLHGIRQNYDSMGPAEKRIADYLFAHTEEIIGISISELAEKCACGSATAVRFARRLGLEGYQELKVRLAAEVGSASVIDEEFLKTDNCYRIYRKRIASIAESLRETEAVLDEETLEKVAQAVLHADRIVIFGLGNSASIAQDASHKFLRLGLDAQACCDNHMQAIIASHLKRGSIAIGISHSGASRDIVDAMRLCKVCGATTACITNYGASPLADAVDYALFTRSRETKHSILAMNSRLSQLAIIDCIYTYIVLHADKAAKQAIYNTEVALQSKKF